MAASRSVDYVGYVYRLLYVQYMFKVYQILALEWRIKCRMGSNGKIRMGTKIKCTIFVDNYPTFIHLYKYIYIIYIIHYERFYQKNLEYCVDI